MLIKRIVAVDKDGRPIEYGATASGCKYQCDIFFKRKQAESQNMMSDWSEGLLKKTQFMMIN